MNTSTPTEREPEKIIRDLIEWLESTPGGLGLRPRTSVEEAKQWLAARQHESSLATLKAEVHAFRYGHFGYQCGRCGAIWAESNGVNSNGPCATLATAPQAPHAAPAVPAGDVTLTAEDVAQARELIFECTATDLLSGDRSAKKADRVWVYRKLCEAAGLLLGDFPPPAPPLPAGECRDVDLPERVIDTVAQATGLCGPFTPTFYKFAQELKTEILARLPAVEPAAAVVEPAPPAAEVEKVAIEYKRIGYIHEGDKFIYDGRGKPTDKPVYIRTTAASIEAEPVEGDLPARIWLNDLGTTQKLSFSPIAGAREHFEYVLARHTPAEPAQADGGG